MKTNVNTVDMAIESAVSAAKEQGQILRQDLNKLQTASQLHINNLMNDIEVNDRRIKTLESARKNGTTVQKTPSTTTTRTTYTRRTPKRRGNFTVRRPARIVVASKTMTSGAWYEHIQRALQNTTQPLTRKELVRALVSTHGGKNATSAYNRAYAAVTYQLNHNNITTDSGGYIRWNAAQPTQAASA